MWQKFCDWLKSVFATKPVAISNEQQAPVASGIQAKLSWEKYPENKPWSEFVFNTVMKPEYFDLFCSAKDITRFRPDFESLTKDQKGTVIAEIFSAIAFPESGWNPVSRMTETTMGTDPITGKQVVSEGLLQLSYQDIQWAKPCRFDWSKDKLLGEKDPKKTILDPYINLECGIGIMAGQIKRTGKFILPSGVYWAVLKEGGKYSAIDSIIERVKSLKFTQVTKDPQVVTKPELSNVLDSAPWIKPGLPYLGLNESDSKLNDLLVPHWARVGLPQFKTLVGNDHAWCSLFVDWSFWKVAIKGTADAMAASWRTWGKQCPYWFGAVLGIRHPSGNGHVTFFLYWVDESKKLAACYGGNQNSEENVTIYNLSGNAKDCDEVVNGPRWPKDYPDGRFATAEEVRKLIPSAPKASGSTR